MEWPPRGREQIQMPKEAIEDGQAEWQNPAARVKQWRRLKEKQLAGRVCKEAVDWPRRAPARSRGEDSIAEV